MRMGGHALMLKVGADFTQFDRQMSGVKSRMGGVGSLLTNPWVLAGAAAAAAGYIFVNAAKGLVTEGVRAAMKFEHAWAEVNTIINKTRWDVGKAHFDILKQSREIGLSSVDTINAMYQAVSAGFTEQAEATKVVQASAKASIGGLTSQAVAVDAITTGLNSYRMSADQSEAVADKLFQTVKLGKVRFEGLSSSIGRIMPISSRFGISMEETLAGVAMLTKSGLSADEAVTALRAAMNSIASPSEKAAEAAKQLGIGFDLTALQSKGLLGTLGDIVNAAQGNEQVLVDLFGNIRGLTGIMTIAGEGYYDYADAIYEIENASGAAQEAQDEMLNTTEGQYNRFKETMGQLVKKLGDQFLPAIKGFFEGFADEADKYLSGEGGVVSMLKEAVGVTEESGKSIGAAVATWIVDAFKKMYEWADKAITWVVEHGPEVIETISNIGNGFKKLFEFVEKVVNAVIRFHKALADIGIVKEVGGSGIVNEYFKSRGGKKGWPGRHEGGLVGGLGGRDQNMTRTSRGEFVLNSDATAALWPLPAVMNDAYPQRGIYNDRSRIEVHNHFPNAGGPVDRGFVHRFIKPELERAIEMKINPRKRGLR